MRRSVWTCVGAVALTLMVVLAATPAAAKIAVIETHAGQTFEGELISENDRTVTLMIANIETPVKRADIKSMTLKKSGADIYAERRAELKDDDLDGRFALAYDMYEMGELDLAQRETKALMKQFPDSERVERLNGVVADAIALREDRATGNGPSETSPTRPTPTDDDDEPSVTGETVQSLREQQLSDEGINLIRLWELPADLTELKPRIIIPRETIETLLDKYSDREVIPKGRTAQNEFRRGDGWQQLPFFFSVRARELYPEIRVVEDPPVMKTYRNTVAPLYINSYFARTFGQGDVNGLVLFGGRGEKVRAAYTDFYILHKYRDGVAYMIDRNKPDESLLVQWGLPRDQASFKAPDVPGWRPFFTGKDDPKFQKIVEWIDSLYKAVDYGISYTPPAADVEPAAPPADGR